MTLFDSTVFHFPIVFYGPGSGQGVYVCCAIISRHTYP